MTSHLAARKPKKVNVNVRTSETKSCEIIVERTLVQWLIKKVNSPYFCNGGKRPTSGAVPGMYNLPTNVNFRAFPAFHFHVEMSDVKSFSIVSQDITGENGERSKFYLESSNWQLDVALSAFYENSEDPAPAQAGGREETMDTGEEAGGEKAAPAGRVTFGAGGSSSDSEDEGQAFYAGGSTSSGQQVRMEQRTHSRIFGLYVY